MTMTSKERALKIAEQNIRLKRLKSESAARRVVHPDWPSHRQYLYEPHQVGPLQVLETMPVKKLSGIKGRCKYCYMSHWNWWLMDQDDYGCDDLTILLCGRCEHTIAAELLFSEKMIKRVQTMVSALEV